jgi:ATP-dependent DNA helicase RecQ
MSELTTRPSREEYDSQSTVARAAARLGIADLHPEQKQAIKAAFAKRDVLVVLPTGFGKSACYQVPSLIFPRPVIWVSPLLSLLRDQHEKLLQLQVPCVRIDSTVRGRARSTSLARLAAGGPLLLMTTPETLGSGEAQHALLRSGVALAAVDEAHCISEWGHDFRPAYLRLGERLRGLGAPPVMALTATATMSVRNDIIRALGMRDPLVIASSPHRANLAFEVIPCGGSERLRALVRLARRLRRPGLVYCSTTRAVDELRGLLERFGVPTHGYHGRMTAAQRMAEQGAYLAPHRRTVMVATSAFGLGIDKPDIRYVLHYQSPASLEQYVQEAGRAGRDGRRAQCILLHGTEDRAVHEALHAKSRVRPEQLYKLGHALAAWAAESRVPTLEALALSSSLGPRIAAALVAVVAEAGIVRSQDSSVEILASANRVEDDVRRLARQFETLRTQDGHRLDLVASYAHSHECRALFLRRYFGEGEGAPCGLCDVCRARRPYPASFWEPLATPARLGTRRARRAFGKRRAGGRWLARPRR